MALRNGPWKEPVVGQPPPSQKRPDAAFRGSSLSLLPAGAPAKAAEPPIPPPSRQRHVTAKPQRRPSVHRPGGVPSRPPLRARPGAQRLHLPSSASAPFMQYRNTWTHLALVANVSVKLSLLWGTAWRSQRRPHGLRRHHGGPGQPPKTCRRRMALEAHMACDDPMPCCSPTWSVAHPEDLRLLHSARILIACDDPMACGNCTACIGVMTYGGPMACGDRMAQWPSTLHGPRTMYGLRRRQGRRRPLGLWRHRCISWTMAAGSTRRCLLRAIRRMVAKALPVLFLLRMLPRSLT